MDFVEIENTIKEEAKIQGVTMKYICSQIGMTEQGLATSLKKQTLKLETLEKIAKVLNVDLSYFLGDDYEQQFENILDRITDLKRYIRKMALKGKGVIDIDFDTENFQLDFAELKEKVTPSYYDEYDRLFEEMEEKEFNEITKTDSDNTQNT